MPIKRVGAARVALIGAGTIALPYLRGIAATPGFEVVAIASRDGGSARAVAAEHATLRVATVDEILADRDIDYVLNLTPASEHGAVTRACLEAGQSVYSEKPLARDLAEADALIALAGQRGVLLACAPANILWPPVVTARRIIAEGTLGSIAGAVSTLVYPGPELFHPRPAYLYDAAAGPLNDMGVYQVAALMALLGPVVGVSGMASRSRSERNVRVGSDAGTAFPVTAQTHCHALLGHASGAITSLIVSFDGLAVRPPALEIFGSDGALVLLNAHSHSATLKLSTSLGKSEAVPLDGPEWSEAASAIGPTSAWAHFQAGLAVPTSAASARATLAVLQAIATASVDGRRIAV